MICPPGEDTDDAARWWRAYLLAENDQVDELRKLARAGDDDARRQLASWLSDRAFSVRLSDRHMLEEAIEVIRPLADAGDDVAELWLARWLADCDRLDELRQRADGGSYHAGRLLARQLAGHDLLDELRQRADRGSRHAWRELVKKLAERDMHEELREVLDAMDADWRQLILTRPARQAGAGWECSGCLPTWGTKPPGRGWLAGWPGKALWTSSASVPLAETSTPSIILLR